MDKPRMKLTYCGTDSWDRPVFKSESGKYFKSILLEPDGGFPNADEETRERILRELNTSEPENEFEGEPGWPVSRSDFEIVCPSQNKN